MSVMIAVHAVHVTEEGKVVVKAPGTPFEIDADNREFLLKAGAATDAPAGTVVPGAKVEKAEKPAARQTKAEKAAAEKAAAEAAAAKGAGEGEGAGEGAGAAGNGEDDVV